MVTKYIVGIIFSSLIVISGWAAPSSPSLIATTPQPKWSELTVKQKIVLAPLSDDWDSLEYYRQKKWLSIVERFSTMMPEEQRRIQGQMQEWGKLTPAERQLARENFKTASQLPTEKKQELKQKWEEYINLSEDEKEKLKKQAQQATLKPVAKPGVPATTSPASLSAPSKLTPITPPLGTSATEANQSSVSTPTVNSTLKP